MGKLTRYKVVEYEEQQNTNIEQFLFGNRRVKERIPVEEIEWSD